MWTQFSYRPTVVEYIDDTLFRRKDDYGEFRNETYLGNFYEDSEIIAVKQVKGIPDIMYELYYAGIIHFEKVDDIDKILYFVNRPEMVGTKEDISQLAMIFKDLVEMGIYVCGCTFIKDDRGKIYINPPFMLVKYTSADKVKKTTHEYFKNRHLKHYLPKGIVPEMIMGLVCDEEDIIEMMDHIEIY